MSRSLKKFSIPLCGLGFSMLAALALLQCKHVDGERQAFVLQSIPQQGDLPSYGENVWRRYLASIPLAEQRGEAIQKDCYPRILRPSGPIKGVAFLLHGFTACPQQFLEIAEQLTAQGYEVVLPLHPGHGYTPLEKTSDNLQHLPNQGNFNQIYGNFVKSMVEMAREYKGMDRVVAGLSLGGSMAVYAGIEGQDVWTRQLIMVPALEMAVPSSLLAGTLNNLNNLSGDGIFNQSLTKWIFNFRTGWGVGCANERSQAKPRAGICDFLLGNIVGMNQFGYNTAEKISPTRIKTQFVLVEGDGAISNKKALEAAASMSAGPEIQSNPNLLQLCVLPKDLGHSFLSRFDSPAQDKYWIPGLNRELTKFIVKGDFVRQDSHSKLLKQPSCDFDGKRNAP